MFINKIKIKNDRARPLRVGAEGRLAWYRLVDSFKSGAVGLLLLSVVVSVILGSGMALFATMLVAWALFPVLVGLRNVLDAGCAFMLISVGVLAVVGLAQHGHGYLLP